MNKLKLQELCSDFSNLNNEVIQGLEKASQEYPYSQVIHTLLAKASRDNQDSNAGKHLTLAALYATDRKILKTIVQGHFIEPKPESPIATPEPEPVLATEEKEEKETERQSEVIADSTEQETEEHVYFSEEDREAMDHDREAEHLRMEVLENLKHLKGQIAPYQVDEEEPSKPTEPETKKPSTRKTSSTKAKTTVRKTTATKAKTPTKAAAKKTTAKKATATKSSTTKTTAAKPTKAASAKATTAKTRTTRTTKSTKSTPPIEEEDNFKEIIKDIKTRKKQKPGAKQKEQIELINKFIKTEPRITSGKDLAPEEVQEEKVDLSENSISFGENLVSENLAKIFIDQGKKDKAIDIYKKLIWKFPQKKAYFAACIEELNKD